MSISAELVADGQIDVDAFRRAVTRGDTVGVCDECAAGQLVGRVDGTRRVLFLTTTCDSCGREKTSPGGRLGKPTDWSAPKVPTVDQRAAWAAHDRAVLGERDDELAVA